MVNTASTENLSASCSDATVYAFLFDQPKGVQLVHEDLEQLHDDDLEEIDLKWNMALLSMRARKFYQRTGRKIIIDGKQLIAGYDKSKLKPKAVKIEDASEKAMCAIDGAGFDWSDMAEEEIQANMALMAFSDSEVANDKPYDEDDDEPNPKVEKKTIIPTATKKEFVKPVKRSVRYAEMYRSLRPRGKPKGNWKMVINPNQLGNCHNIGLQETRSLYKDGLKLLIRKGPVNMFRSVNTGQGGLMLLSPQHVGFGDPSNPMGAITTFSSNIITIDARGRSNQYWIGSPKKNYTS
ncbi:hypothetical protein Tco_0569070 [Tanacetum coccineum]